MLPTQGDTMVYKAHQLQPRHCASFRIFRPLDFISTLATHLRDSQENRVADNDRNSNIRRVVSKKDSLRPPAMSAAPGPK